MLTRRHKVMLVLERNPDVTALELTALAREKEFNVRAYLMWASYAGAVKTEQPKGRKRYSVCPGWLATLEKYESNPRVRAGHESGLPRSERTTKPNKARLQSARIKELLELAASVNPSVQTVWVKPLGKRKPHHWHQQHATQNVGVAA